MPSRVKDIGPLISDVQRTRLISLPTPLEKAKRLGGELGLDLWIKRDDLTGIGCGGNKLRKLEFIAAQAQLAGVDTLLTTGGAQSNHARLTAAVAAKLGMSCELYLKGEPTEARQGNLLLDTLFGATINFCGIVDYGEISARMAQRVEDLAQAGRKAFAVPLGGATGHGTLGYVEAFVELAGQLSQAGEGRPATIVVSGGTGSTAAGLLLGAALVAPETRFVVVSASWTRERLTDEIQRCIQDAAKVLKVPVPSADNLTVTDEYIGPGYAQPSKAGIAAVLAVARSEGVLLDTTYTGKAMSGLIAMAASGKLKGAPLVFLHTGGTPEIFTRETTYCSYFSQASI